jgi:hypothetical protein
MQVQLEELEKESNIEWHEYKIGDLFNNIVQGRRLKKQDHTPGKLPFIMAGVTNNGIVNCVSNEVRIFPENSLTVDIFGNIFYRDYQYGLSDDVGAYWNTDSNFSKATMLYIATAMRRSMSGKFDFGRKLRSSRSLDFKIQLPTAKINGKTDIAYEFMEKFFALLNAERIALLNAERTALLNAYLSATGLSDYVLTDEEQVALNNLGSVTWGKFRIEDVLVWQQNISELNPLHLKSLTISDEKKYPFYGQSTTNNGIIEYRHLNDEVLNNKFGLPTILIHSNNQNTVYLETPFYLKDGHGATSVLQSENLNKLTAQFLMGSIKKVILQKYSYDAKATKIELKNTDIILPVNSENYPHYEYMKLVILAMQKVVIINMVNDLDVRIKKAIEILQ